MSGQDAWSAADLGVDLAISNSLQAGKLGALAPYPRFQGQRLMREQGFWIRFVLAILATWRITHLLALEDGPAEIVVRLRLRLGRSFAGTLMDCFKCLSLWIAAPAALFVARRPLDWVFAWLALSGAACLLERLGGEPVAIPPHAQPLEGELDNVLRPETIDSPSEPGAGADGER